MLTKMVQDAIHHRVLLLAELNRTVELDLSAMIDVTAPADSPSGGLLARVRPLVLFHYKDVKMRQGLFQTPAPPEAPTLPINRKAANCFCDRGHVDWGMERSLFGQILRTLIATKVLPHLFFRKRQEHAFKVSYSGEETDDEDDEDDDDEDDGGDDEPCVILDALALELQSKCLPLLLPCTDSVRGVGEAGAVWVLNPRATTPECMLGFEFLGQLMGLSLRTDVELSLSLAPFTWKGILGEKRTLADIREVDHFVDQTLTRIASEPPDLDGLTFACIDIVGDEMELVEGGKAKPVTPENLEKFKELLSQRHLTCDDEQLKAVRQGLRSVLGSLKFIGLWTWRNLQDKITGTHEVDLDVLRTHATYTDCDAADEAVKMLWDALGKLTQRQRKSFLLQLCSRCKLDADNWDGSDSFTVILTRVWDDSRTIRACPRTSTLILPHYSSVEVCRIRLLQCVVSYPTIDPDDIATHELCSDAEI